jgi:hypothetical protein
MYLQFNDYSKLFEGGAAFDNMERFSNEDKPVIVEKVTELLNEIGYDPKDWKIAGSFNIKRENIGDIDIVLYDSKFKFDDLDKTYENIDLIAKKVEKAGHKTIKKSKTLGVLSIKMKVSPKRYAQIDIIPVPSLKWVYWSYFAPEKSQSDYKGLYRNALLEAIAKSLHFRIEKYTKEEETEYFKEGDVKSYLRYRYIRNSGLWTVKEVNVGKRVFNYQKERETYTRITHNKDRIIKYLLGKGNADDYKTFESVWKVISDKNWGNFELLPTILENFKIIIVDRQGNQLPSEAKETMKKMGLKISK